MPVDAGAVMLVTPRWTRNGGVATHVMASANALAEHGVDVHVLAARIETDEVPAGVTVHRAPLLYKPEHSPADRLGEAGALRPSVFHLHQFDDPAVLALMQTSAPVVVSCHGYTGCTSTVHYFRPGHECERPHGPGCVPNLIFRGCAHTRDPRSLPAAYRNATLGVDALARADLAIAYSSTIDRHLAANGIARRAIVPLFATMAPATVAEDRARRRVVFAGRVVTPKGVGVLIRAAREVEAEFVVCGDGWQLEAMRKLARRLGVDDRVRFTGWLGPSELAGELAAASVVAMPSLWPEPFGLVGIEAHAAGRPVVASATGGVRDWLQDGVSGMLVAPGDPRALAGALSELLADPARQQAMGEAGKEHAAQRFTPARHVAALVESYRTARSFWQSRRDGGHAGGHAENARAQPMRA